MFPRNLVFLQRLTESLMKIKTKTRQLLDIVCCNKIYYYLHALLRTVITARPRPWKPNNYKDQRWLVDCILLSFVE
jgi:hypothetical protein